MDSSCLLYREYMNSYAIGKIILYQDAKYSVPPVSECKYEFFVWSLKRWVCNEIIARIVESDNDSVTEVIRSFIRELESFDRDSQIYTHRIYFSIAALEAKNILKIFSKGDSK